MKHNENLSYAIGGQPTKGSPNKFNGNMNQHGNPDALINKGRGPTVGNKSDKDPTYPGAASLPKFSPGKEMFMGSSNPQVRNPGGTKEMPYCGKETFNYGRGPTKGNMK